MTCKIADEKQAEKNSSPHDDPVQRSSSSTCGKKGKPTQPAFSLDELNTLLFA
ncbi:MAG: hypothetical protein GY796_22985 [Chloroflexi bacterium]|nr:hypothetical protein [Chloroflexota bacterium]